VETEALALGVAVESLVRREFKNLGIPDLTFVEAIESALEHIDSWVGPEDVKERVRNSISGMRGTNPRAALKKLVDVGVLRKDHLSAWNKIRHPTAHGNEFHMPFREIVRQCDLTYSALTRLIFAVIGYQGPYTDYSVEGWPTVEYP
jgi:hypothetical protein